MGITPSGDERRDLTVNRDVFRRDELDIINKLMEKGSWNKIAAAIIIDSPEKEKEIQKIIAKYAPDEVIVASEVQQEIYEAERRAGSNIITPPEEQAKWQKKIDKEVADKKAAVKEGKSPHLVLVDKEEPAPPPRIEEPAPVSAEEAALNVTLGGEPAPAPEAVAALGQGAEAKPRRGRPSKASNG